MWRENTTSFCSDDKAGPRVWILVRICCEPSVRSSLDEFWGIPIWWKWRRFTVVKKKKWPWWGQRKVMNFFPQSIKRTIFGATMWWRTKRVLVIKWSAYSTRQRRKSRLFLTTHLNCFVLERTNDLARIEWGEKNELNAKH